MLEIYQKQSHFPARKAPGPEKILKSRGKDEEDDQPEVFFASYSHPQTSLPEL